MAHDVCVFIRKMYINRYTLFSKWNSLSFIYKRWCKAFAVILNVADCCSVPSRYFCSSFLHKDRPPAIPCFIIVCFPHIRNDTVFLLALDISRQFLRYCIPILSSLFMLRRLPSMLSVMHIVDKYELTRHFLLKHNRHSTQRLV